MGLGGLVTGITAYTNGNSDQASTPDASAVAGSASDLWARYNRSAQPVTLATYQAMQPQYAALDTSIYGNAVKSLFPSGVSALQGAVPGLTNLYSSMLGDASNQINAGASLDPALQATAEQSVRGAQSARGLGRGPSDALEESRSLTSLGSELRSQRESYARGVASDVNSAFVTPAWNAATGEASNILGTSASALPTSAQSYDNLNTAYNAAASTNISNANTQASLEQGLNSFD